MENREFVISILVIGKEKADSRLHGNDICFCTDKSPRRGSLVFSCGKRQTEVEALKYFLVDKSNIKPMLLELCLVN